MSYLSQICNMNSLFVFYVFYSNIVSTNVFYQIFKYPRRYKNSHLRSLVRIYTSIELYLFLVWHAISYIFSLFIVLVVYSWNLSDYDRSYLSCDKSSVPLIKDESVQLALLFFSNCPNSSNKCIYIGMACRY